MASWPISTPTLNSSRAIARADSGSPISASAPAKPKPCSRPKPKAMAHGERVIADALPCAPRASSTARNRMLSAITASTGRCDSVITPSVDSANVML